MAAPTTLSARSVARSVLLRAGLANVAGGLLVGLVAVVTNPGDNPASNQQVGSAGWDDLVQMAVFTVLFVVIGVREVPRFERRYGWIIEGEQKEGEATSVLRAPWRLALLSLGMWALVALHFTVLNMLGDHATASAARVGLTILLGGLTTAAATYLLVEAALRPVFASVLARVPLTRRQGLGIDARLLLSWALGSVVPLLVIGLMFFERDRPADEVGAQVGVVVTVAIVSGGLLTWVAARSVFQPVERVRKAMARVQEGALEVEVPVDDADEVGLLQAGFNRMVAGLRERQAVQDLFGRHVGAEVARQALERGASLGGERRDASVLFVDLIGSTRLAQTHAPEDVVAILNAYFDAVVRRIGAEGGWVNKFQGDGALCVFGVPAEQPDHADRALRAARALRRDLLALAAVHAGLDAAIGVSSGTVVAGNVGNEQRFEYTVIGDPVNEASRLTDAAKSHLGRVLASDESVDRASGEAAQWVVGGELLLRGRDEATLTYEPAGPRTRSEPRPEPASDRPT